MSLSASSFFCGGDTFLASLPSRLSSVSRPPPCTKLRSCGLISFPGAQDGLRFVWANRASCCSRVRENGRSWFPRRQSKQQRYSFILPSRPSPLLERGHAALGRNGRPGSNTKNTTTWPPAGTRMTQTHTCLAVHTSSRRGGSLMPLSLSLSRAAASSRPSDSLQPGVQKDRPY